MTSATMQHCQLAGSRHGRIISVIGMLLVRAIRPQLLLALEIGRIRWPVPNPSYPREIDAVAVSPYSQAPAHEWND